MNQRRYETLFLLHPDLSEEEISEIEEKCTNIINQSQGKLLTLDRWGHRKLAYEVKGQTRGFYFLLDYVGGPDMLAEIERQMRIDERVFRYMSLILEREFNEEKYQQALALREAEAKKAMEEAEAQAAEPGEQKEMAEDSSPTEDSADSILEETPADQVETSESKAFDEEVETSDEDKAVLGTEPSPDSEADAEEADNSST
ncbi:MAG: 30S ribosomal protein S6 [Deltaproteobacteria bacterium]|nr:30S ribosomal protein S6 [Deltaproteobacteria bacterium]